MSYIRCLSNPESLYVYGGPDDKMQFSWTDRQGELQYASCPYEDFDAIFKMAEESDFLWMGEPIVSGSLCATEVVYDNNKQRVLTPEEDKIRCEAPLDERSDVDHLVCLQIGDAEPLLMWTVTWRYLEHNVMWRASLPSRLRLTLSNWWWIVRDFFCGEDKNE